MGYQILTDEDLHRLLDMPAVIEIMEAAFLQKAAGELTHPPRIHVNGKQGAMIFTAGESPGRGLGFRVYTMFKDADEKRKQLVAVFDDETGAFKGAVIGTAVGELRTGAIGGVAVKHLARPAVQVLGVLGTGRQAVTQLQAATAVRDFDRVLVFSRDPGGRETFAGRMSAELGLEIRPVDSARAAVEPADVLLCCTTSPKPVFEPEWVRPGTHVTTIGPHLKTAHELPVEAALRSDLIVTDTRVQIEDMGARHFLHGQIDPVQYIALSDLVAGNHPGRTREDERTLFCSVGLAGTEVALAAEVLRLNLK